MRLHSILAHEELLGDLAGAQAGGDVGEDLVLARGDAELLEPRAVDDEGIGRADDDDLLLRLAAGHAEAEPDPQRGEDQGDEGAVDLERVFDDEEAVLEELEGDEEGGAEEAVEEYGAAHSGVSQWRTNATTRR